MEFSVLTYNTLFNRAYERFEGLIRKHSPDVICLQEVHTSDRNLKLIGKYGYRLAESVNSFVNFGKIYGVATYYRKETMKFRSARTLDLNMIVSEYFYYLIRLILGYNQPKTILKTNFIHLKSKKPVSVCNLHLYVIGSNELRLRHLNQALQTVKIEKDPALIVCGDFNYFPYGRKRLERTMAKFHLVEATKSIRQTMGISSHIVEESYTRFQRFMLPLFNRFLIKAMKTDYVFYRGMKLVKNTRIEADYSDHYPILSIFRI